MMATALDALARDGALDGLPTDSLTTAVPLQGHASTRRFFRVVYRGGATGMLMVYPSADAQQQIERFALTTQWYQRAGIVVPGIVHRGVQGLLVEDVGDRLLVDALEPRHRLYRQAARVLVKLQRHARRCGAPVPGRALDSERLRFEMHYMEEHALGAWLDAPADDGTRERFYDELVARVAALPQTLCHRDFHARNLMVRSERLVVVDHQDTMRGPALYDAVSLLLDNYVDVPPDVVAPFLAELEAAAGRPHRVDPGLAVPPGPRGLAPGARQAFALTAAQRTLKALGTFGYQATQRGRTDFLQYVPRTWSHARRALTDLGFDEAVRALAAFERAVA